MGWNGGGNGTINLTDGEMQANETTFVGFTGGTGVLNISGGNYIAGGNSSPGFDGFGSFRIGDWGLGTGTVNLSSNGVITASQYTAVGGNGNGTLNITGGTWNQAAGGIVVGDAADLNWTGSGEVNQSGGTVNADYIFLQKGTYNLNGGVLAAFGVADTKTATRILTKTQTKIKTQTNIYKTADFGFALTKSNSLFDKGKKLQFIFNVLRCKHGPLS